MNTTIITKKNVRNYIEKFLDGETSNAEEQALYDFFKNEDVPQSLQEYAPMFAWYDGKMEEDPRRLIEENRRQSRIIRIRLVRWSIAAAAMAIMDGGCDGERGNSAVHRQHILDEHLRRQLRESGQHGQQQHQRDNARDRGHHRPCRRCGAQGSRNLPQPPAGRERNRTKRQTIIN